MRRSYIVAALLFLTVSYATPASAAEITFRSSVDANNNTLVSIEILGVPDLSVFDFGITVNPGATLLQVDEGSFLSGPTMDDPVVRPTAFFSFQDPVDLAVLRITNVLLGGPGVSGSGILAVLLFSGIAPTDLGLLFTLSGRTPDETLGFFDSQGALLDVTELDMNPTPVPEPSTLGLLGTGLAVLARRFRRKNQIAA